MVQLLQRPVRLGAACVATILGPVAVAHAGSVGAHVRGARAPLAVVSAEVPRPVPGDGRSWLAAARSAAATCPGLPPAVLVAIGQVETGLGSRPGTSPAGAEGPMQFLPATWAAYGQDGDGDGRADLLNPLDALYGATRLLCANGGADPDRLASAVWNYNHSDEYVRRVLDLTRS